MRQTSRAVVRQEPTALADALSSTQPLPPGVTPLDRGPTPELGSVQMFSLRGVLLPSSTTCRHFGVHL